MGLRDKLRRLEQLEGETVGVLVLPDGSEVRYRLGSPDEGGDLYEAFVACVKGQEHWLLPYTGRWTLLRVSRGLSGHWKVAESE
jgi:hypothetical protein